MKHGQRIHINMTELGVTKCPNELVCMGLGSCVGLILYDATTKVGGVAHIMLPNSRGVKTTHPGKFADTALQELLKKMRTEAGALNHVQALVVGGANMFPARGKKKRFIGSLNTEAVINGLKSANIPLIAQDVGGHEGRSIYFEVCTGTVTMKKLKESTEKCFVFEEDSP